MTYSMNHHSAAPRRSQTAVPHPFTGCPSSLLRCGLQPSYRRDVASTSLSRATTAVLFGAPQLSPSDIPLTVEMWSIGRIDVTWTTCRDSPIKTGEGEGGGAWFQQCGVWTAVGAVPTSLLCVSHWRRIEHNAWIGSQRLWVTDCPLRRSSGVSEDAGRAVNMAERSLCHMLVKQPSNSQADRRVGWQRRHMVMKRHFLWGRVTGPNVLESLEENMIINNIYLYRKRCSPTFFL